MARDQQLIEEAGISFRLLMQSSQLTGISEDKALIHRRDVGEWKRPVRPLPKARPGKACSAWMSAKETSGQLAHFLGLFR